MRTVKGTAIPTRSARRSTPRSSNRHDDCARGDRLFERSEKKPYFYANAHEKDFIPLKPAEVEIADARGQGCSLDAEGFALVEHRERGGGPHRHGRGRPTPRGRDRRTARARHRLRPRQRDLLAASCASPKSSARTQSHDNSHPARFVHVDMAKEVAAEMRAKGAPEGKTIVRSAQYNVWRALSGAPQDVPLGLCAYPSIAPEDLLDCDAIFDPPDGSPEWGFPNYLLGRQPRPPLVLLFEHDAGRGAVVKTSDSEPARARLMPHGAFDNPLAGPDAPPRVSLEMRGGVLLVRISLVGERK